MLKADYLSSICMELYLILQAGISVSEGFMLLSEDEKNAGMKNLLTALYDKTVTGVSLAEALGGTGAFPSYMVNMIEIGERTGNTDSVLKALSLYYDRQVSISRTVRSAVVYPTILFFVMLAVIAVLVVEVLPIFNEVFIQLGSTMSPVAMAFLSFGLFLRDIRYILLAVAIVIIAFALAVVFVPSAGAWFSRFISGVSAKTRLGRQIDTARFASAMAMTLSSGLDVDNSLEMAQRLSTGSSVLNKVTACRDLITGGMSFSEAIAQVELFDPLFCRMLSIGVKTGAADTVMEEIARRSEEDVNTDIEKTIGKVEPALVVIMSLLVGLVLLSVMLPLMGIMSSIG